MHGSSHFFRNGYSHGLENSSLIAHFQMPHQILFFGRLRRLPRPKVSGFAVGGKAHRSFSVGMQTILESTVSGDPANTFLLTNMAKDKAKLR
jgi:hypothetical protein